LNFEIGIDEHDGGLPVVSVRGEVDLHTAPKVEYAIEKAGGNGASAVVVDMSGIAFMDSTGLSTFMRAKDSLAKNETSLRLAALSQAVERIFSVTGFNEYFEVFETREEAIFAN
jgi:anti-sigma B factor antagonist